jgi:hypothetical protein
MASTLRKNAAMLRVEEVYGERLESLLPRLINAKGITGTGTELGISKSSVNYWCMKLGIIRQTVALVPGERVEVRGRPRIEGD